jgi:type 2A phosphatase activator TIP41
MHLPEATFGANKLMLTHEPSGFVLSFTAEGALRAWARDSVLSDRELHIRVAPAEKAVWRSRVAAAQERTSQAVDWTFCSGEYGGDDHGTGGGGGGGGGGVGGAGAATALPGLPKPALSAGATARSGAAGGGATSIRGAATPSPSGARGPAVVWREHEGSGLDMDLLRRRDEIVWAAEVPLYEDHLHDQGVSTLIARIRVMPQCFLVLLRHTLRVDGRLMQQREVRVFHRIGTGMQVLTTAPPPPHRYGSSTGSVQAW